MTVNNPRAFIDNEMRKKLIKLWGKTDYQKNLEAYSKLLKEGKNIRAALNRLIEDTDVRDISEENFIRVLEDVTTQSQQHDEEKSKTSE